MGMESISQVSPGEELNDTTLSQEIEFLGELMERLAKADHPLCQAEIDDALQVTSAPNLEPSQPAAHAPG